MKNFVVAVLSAVILAGAYVFSFGVPAQVATLLGTEQTQADAAPARGGGAPGGRGGRGNQATTVVLTPLEQESYALVLRTIGSATAIRSADVAIAQAGEIVEVAMAPNSRVEKGDVLLRLDDRAEKLALEIAEATRDQALSTVTRYETLEASGNLSISEVTIQEAENEMRLAEVQVAIAQLNLDNRTLLAPISGQLGLTNVDVGDLLSVGDPVVTIDDTTSLLAEFEVPERSVALLAEGKEVLIGTPTYRGRVFPGTIVAFDSRLDSLTRSATVQARIDNPDGLLLSGMTFTVRIFDNTDAFPVVSATSITWNRDGSGIWVVDEDGIVSRQPVAILYRDGDRVWLDTKVALGSSVVTEGASKLREGAKVTDANATTAPSAPERS